MDILKEAQMTELPKAKTPIEKLKHTLDWLENAGYVSPDGLTFNDILDIFNCHC